jgi:SAM-dependent methyltransferase
MAARSPHPLDYGADDYAYVERPNGCLLELFASHVLAREPAPRVLDIGAGAGANARALRALASGVHIAAIEPNARARALLATSCDELYADALDAWLATPRGGPFQAVLLADVLEHLADPLSVLRRLAGVEAVRGATLLISVPNYAVWYNRLLTLAGRFEYAPSGLFDRTHLRFFTRSSVRRLLEHVGFRVLEQRATPSLAQSLAPWLRRGYERDVAAGRHLTLESSRLYRAYTRFVEPTEARVCELWPELLGFQIVSVARLDRA